MLGEVVMATPSSGVGLRESANPVISVTNHVVTGVDPELDHSRLQHRRRHISQSSSQLSAPIDIPMGTTALAAPHSFPGIALEAPELQGSSPAQVAHHAFFGRKWSAPSGPAAPPTPPSSSTSATPSAPPTPDPANMDPTNGPVIPLAQGNQSGASSSGVKVTEAGGSSSASSSGGGFVSFLFSSRFFTEPRPPLSARELNMLSIGK